MENINILQSLITEIGELIKLFFVIVTYMQNTTLKENYLLREIFIISFQIEKKSLISK